MNSDQPSRDQIEARITALLLGELPAEEAELLRYTISQDSELRKLHDELKAALPLIREAEKTPADAPAEIATTLKLSLERRQKLLEHFKQPRKRETPAARKQPEPLFWLKRITIGSRLVEILGAVAVIALLAAMLLPALSTAKMKAQRISTLNMARQRALEAQIEAEGNLKRDSLGPVPQPSSPATSPAVLTIVPKPQLAPPPAISPNTLIVLPQAEPPPDIAAQSGASTETGKSHVYSQHIVGYVNIPAPPPAAAPAPTDFPNQLAIQTADQEAVRRQANMPAVNKKPSQINANFLALNGERTPNTDTIGKVPQTTSDNVTVGTLIQDGKVLYEMGKFNEAKAKLDQAAKVDPENSTANYYRNLIAQDEAIGNGTHHETDTPDRLESVEKQWILPHHSARPVNNGSIAGIANAYASTGGSRNMGASIGGVAVAAQTPASGQLNYSFNGTASSSSKTDTAVQSFDTHATLNGFYDDSAGKPLSMNSEPPAPPAAGSITAPESADSQTSYVIKSGDTLTRIARQNHTTVRALKEVNSLDSDRIAAGAKLKLPTASTEQPSPIVAQNATTPTPTLDSQQLATINSRMIEDEKIRYEEEAQLKEIKSLEKTDKEKLTETLPQIVGDSTLGDLVNKRDEARRRLLTLTNDYVMTDTSVPQAKALVEKLDAEIDDRTAGIVAGMESKAASINSAIDGLNAEADKAKNLEKDASEQQPYYDAARNLDQKLKAHQLLYSKLEAEKLDIGLPEKSMVQLTDPAEPNRNQTFWQRLTGQYASTARLKVENDVTDIPGMSATTPQSYDPYFIQTTFEFLKSPLVLSNVVAKLNLPAAWSKKNGGEKMTEQEAISELKNKISLQPVKNTTLIAINVTSDDPNEAANIANAVAEAYKDYRYESRRELTKNGVAELEEQFEEQERDIATNKLYVDRLRQGLQIPDSDQVQNPAQTSVESDAPARKPAPNTPVPQPEILTRDNNFSTFSLNVSDVSFKFAEASLQNGKLPDTASIRSEEFINAFDYRDPEAAPGQPMAFASERAHYPFAHNRDLLRFAIKTAATGREQGRALNLVLLLDVSGSMERADRVSIIHEALRVLATQLQPQDTVSVVTFARTARLWADGISGDKAGETLDRVGGITPEGGTNLEEAMRLAYETAHRHYLANGINRVVLLTDGAANLGDVKPADLKLKVEAQRKQGIALDCFGIGWEDYNDDLLEQLSSTGDGRYAFLNSPEDASKDFASKLAGALQIAAADVKVQVEFNPQRVVSYRQIGYATHQLTKEQFRDNTVAAGQIAAQEAGNALYTIETNPNGEGRIATVHVRYKVPGTEEYREHSWNVDYTGNAPSLDQSSPAMRLAATASAFSEWLAASPYAQEVTPDALLKYLSGVPEIYGADDRPKQLETMIQEARSLEGK